jgi:tRNA1(Val) A37 N6-methylase TrmN6
MKNISTKKKRGAFYTDIELSEFLTEKLLKLKVDSILEPSFGDGIFLRSLTKKRGSLNITAIELHKPTYEKTKEIFKKEKINFINDNFLNINQKFDAIIGNPPFVRIRNLEKNQKIIAENIIIKKFGNTNLDSSLYIPFLIHSISILNKNGHILFILPYDFTFINYGKKLWSYICNNFENVDIYRTKKRYFKNILQETIIFIASNKGLSTDSINYYISDDLKKINSSIKIYKEDIISNKKIFIHCLLNKKINKNLLEKITKKTTKLSEYCKFHIGYVTGDKEFFHPNKDIINQFDLPKKNFISSIFKSKYLDKIGLFTSELKKQELQNLYYPQNITSGDKNYLNLGINTKVNLKYKCRVREEWFKVPLIKTPDIILKVFGENPVLLINNGKYLATNSFLCGYLKNIKDLNLLVASWFTSITHLYSELSIHSLGGGLLIYVPKEMADIRIPLISSVPKYFLEKINSLLIKSQIKEAFELGDELILKEILKFNDSEILEIRKSAEILKSWRVNKHLSKF